jgi:hypothetical protein
VHRAGSILGFLSLGDPLELFFLSFLKIDALGKWPSPKLVLKKLRATVKAKVNLKAYKSSDLSYSIYPLLKFVAWSREELTF